MTKWSGYALPICKNITGWSALLLKLGESMATDWLSIAHAPESEK